MGRGTLFFDEKSAPPQTPPFRKHDQRAGRPLDSGQRSWFWRFGGCGLRDWDRCQARLFQRAVCSSRDWAGCWKRLWRAFLLVARVMGLEGSGGVLNGLSHRVRLA